MKKILLAIIFTFIISGSGFAASEGSEELSKNNNKPVKDCFEGLNRGIFAFNKALDDIIVEPIATGYRKLP